MSNWTNHVLSGLGYPLSLAAPAVAAAAAYLNAQHSIFYDQQLVFAIVPTILGVLWRQHRGRLNLFCRLQDLATSKASAQRVFLRFEDKTWTYLQGYELVLRYANWLRTRHGIAAGEVIALDFQNTSDMVFLVLATWALGAKPALINYNLRGRPLIHCLERAAARLLIIDPMVAENVDDDVRSKLSGMTFEVFDSNLEVEAQSMNRINPKEINTSGRIEDMAVLVYTSGTTGLPKAAIVSWGKLAIPSEFTAHWIGTNSKDVFYTVSLNDNLLVEI